MLAETQTASTTAQPLSGGQWVLREADERQVLALAQQLGLPEIVARILVARGVALEEAEDFLNPSLKNQLPDPSHLRDMDKAATRIADAVQADQQIAIFGDYDVDGATSSALLMRYLRALGAKPLVYIPDRMKEGYGPNADALLKLKAQGAQIVITVDCGTLSFEPLQAATDAGLEVIVIDHHTGEARKPACYALVNPNRLDEDSPHGHLAAVGVAFLLVVATNRVLRERQISSPNRGEARRGALRFPQKNILENARDLRKRMTDAEKLLWEVLKQEQLGVKFRKQHPIGSYIADFAALDPKVIVELDGGQHNNHSAQKKDTKRTEFLERQGFTVLRFWNNEVLDNIEGVVQTIVNAISRPHPHPPPQGEGEIKSSPPEGEGISLPNPLDWLDIVALGTVCDVVPLRGVNRALVAQGLKVMAGRNNTGITTVLDMCGVDEKPSVYHLGFVIGPRINAGGRVGQSDLGVRLLTTDDPADALTLAKQLDQYNAERKAIESAIQEAATAQAEHMDNDPLLMVAGQGWHPGVIGIVAGRLKEKFYKPTAVIAIENGIGKASARSVAGFDFGSAVIAAHESGLLLAGGGHAMAAGFTVEEDKIPALADFLRARLPDLPVSRSLKIDAELRLPGLTIELAETLEALGPFGSANPSLKLLIRGVNFADARIVGADHVRVILYDRISNARLPAIAFRTAETALGDAMLQPAGRSFDVVVEIRAEEWQGNRKVGVQIQDIAPSD